MARAGGRPEQQFPQRGLNSAPRHYADGEGFRADHREDGPSKMGKQSETREERGGRAGEGAKPQRRQQVENASEVDPDVRQNGNPKMVEEQAKQARNRDRTGVTPLGMKAPRGRISWDIRLVATARGERRRKAPVSIH